VLDVLSSFDGARGGQRGVLASSSLDGRLLIAADDVVAGMQQLPFPAPGIQVEDPAGLLSELWVPREDPRAVLPRLDRIL
jgi:hypothetical protein